MRIFISIASTVLLTVLPCGWAVAQSSILQPFDIDNIAAQAAVLSTEEKKAAIDELRRLADILADEVKQGESSWISQIQIRQTTKDKNNIDNPGTIQFTLPKDGESSYAIDIGARVSAWATERYEIGPLIEYHKNTEIDKPQDVLLVGGSGSLMLGSQFTDPNADDIEPKLHGWLDGKVEYKRDEAKDTKSWQVSATLTPVYVPRGFGSSVPLSGTNARLRFDTGAGLEYEDIFESGSDKDGYTIRLMARAGIELWPLYSNIKDQFRLGTAVKYWNELSASGDFDDGVDNFDNVTVYATYFLDRKQRIGLALTYLDGDDPSKGLVDQRFVRFGWAIKTGK